MKEHFMKGFRAAVAVASLAFGLLAGCNDYNNSIQYNTGPQVGSISPTGVAAGSSDFLLTVSGDGIGGVFQSGSAIQWNGKKLSPCVPPNTMMCTNFLNSITLSATIPGSFVATPNHALINVLTPQSGNGNNGLSNTKSFFAFGSPNPVPTLMSITPNSAAACGTSCSNASVTITVMGSDFLPSSNNGGTLVTFANNLTPMKLPASLTITSFSTTSIKAVIPGSYLANNDTAVVQVINPPNIPGGGGQQCPDANCVKLAGGGANPMNENQSFTVGSGAAPAAASIAEETPAISQDGRYVAYASQQNQLVQILLKDTCVGAANGCSTSMSTVSVSTEGTAGNADSHNAVITPDGRYVAFSSAATNLVENAPKGRQVYVHDTCIGATGSCKPSTSLISTDADGALNGTESILPSISTSGRFVAFLAITTSATEKTTGAGATARTNSQSSPNSGLRQVFVRDTCLGAANCTPKTTRISLAPGDGSEDGTKPAGPAISGQAKQIALADGKSATVFTPTVAVDDRVVLAVPKEQ
jgi:hypothetical protein